MGYGADSRGSGTGRMFDLRLRIRQRLIQRPDRRIPRKSLIMTPKGADLLHGLVGIADQRRATGLRG